MATNVYGFRGIAVILPAEGEADYGCDVHAGVWRVTLTRYFKTVKLFGSTTGSFMVSR